MELLPEPLDHERLHSADADVEDAVSAAVAALRRRGQRMTAPRRAVLEVLAAHADLLTADEVAALLEDTGAHRATVYRTLDLLAETGVVSHRHTPGSATRYHLSATGPGQAHLHGHCQRCGAVVVLPRDALDIVGGRLYRESGFMLDVWQSSLTGLCSRCGRNGGAAGAAKP